MPPMLRWRRVGVLLLLAACTSDAGSGTTTTTQSTATTATPAPTATIARPATDQLLEDLDASLCPDSVFTCVTLDMPMNHFDAADERTIPVTFAVLPATGERLGAFVTATGGPGSSGIAVADSYTDALDPAIPESYDIVFFDQRGVAMSGGLSCPQAAGAYYRVDATTALGFDQEELTSAASTFADDCVVEMGDPEMLPYLGTDQVVEDLEVFRDTFGYEQIVLYGESYGTQVSQTYAAAHGDRVARLILDGTVDLTLEAFDFFDEQATAFGDTLQSTLDYCAEDEFCASDLGVAPDEAYDQLLALLAEEPLTAQYPLPSGGFEERTFGLGDLEVVASGQMYSEDDRMMFLRALAAHSGRGDLVPLLRLLYLNLGIDAETEAVLEDPTYSDAIYYAVECLDYHYPGIDAGRESAGLLHGRRRSQPGPARHPVLRGSALCLLAQCQRGCDPPGSSGRGRNAHGGAGRDCGPCHAVPAGSRCLRPSRGGVPDQPARRATCHLRTGQRVPGRRCHRLHPGGHRARGD